MQSIRPFALALGLLTLAAALPAAAAEHEVRMLNFVQRDGTTELMVFEPSFLQVEPGDTVSFVPADRGHNSVSQAVPEGAEPWRSPLNESFQVTLQQEGVYLYACEPHLSMAMVGVIQVGSASNLEDVRARAAALEQRIAMNRDRLGRALDQVTP